MYNMLKLCNRATPTERAILLPSYRHRKLNSSTTTACCRHASQSCAAEESAAAPAAAVNFDQLIRTRRDEAARSILVQVNSDKSHPELHRYCSQYGSIRSAHHYTHDDMHYIVLEYEAAEAARAAVESGTYNEDCAGIVVQSPFLWFRAGPKKTTLRPTKAAAADSAPAAQQQPDHTTTAPPRLDIVDGNRHATNDSVNCALRQAASVNEQMVSLHRLTCLNDIGTRLRFLAARQIEQSLHGMFPHAAAFPFGSSVNGFGRLGCDLDMILRLGADAERPRPEARLVYHTKENLSNGRSQTQRQMESISDMLQLFLPGVCHVRRILQARVPIIKYHHDHMNLEVDLSMSNLTGVYMSELLYMFGQLDARVMPLIFTVRHWAHCVGLTNASPGRWISNFSLTCLVIFYLQQLPVPILPAINTLIQNARRPADVRITEDGINCTFLRDLSAVRQLTAGSPTPNHSSLADLLVGFFEFYAQMNFAERAISLNEARFVCKPDHSAVYIVNPLEAQLNVSKNISAEECERFRIEVRNAAWSLDSFGEPNPDGEWGVLSIARSAGAAATASSGGGQHIRANMFFRPRMVDVSELFAGDDDRQAASAAHTHVQFKNDLVRSSVEKIQRKAREDLQKIESQLTGKGGNNAGNTGSSTGALPTRLRKR